MTELKQIPPSYRQAQEANAAVNPSTGLDRSLETKEDDSFSVVTYHGSDTGEAPPRHPANLCRVRSEEDRMKSRLSETVDKLTAGTESFISSDDELGNYSGGSSSGSDDGIQVLGLDQFIDSVSQEVRTQLERPQAAGGVKDAKLLHAHRFGEGSIVPESGADLLPPYETLIKPKDKARGRNRENRVAVHAPHKAATEQAPFKATVDRQDVY
ncbi:hypothetical protein NMY22_g11784 [Coprinellus aureogranulatus]|nr:hypothetical protein NMY22_g11784 [Coprinellus aureogranulatus]